MRFIFTFLSILSFTILNAQEKIIEFQTTHANSSTGQGSIMSSGAQGSAEMPMNFVLYNDSLIMEYQDKRTIKQLKKLNQDITPAFPYTFTKKQGKYEFRNEELRIQVINPSTDSPSVRMQTKDSFTGKTTDQLFYKFER